MGHSLYRELELYVRAGFTPMEAIQAATLVPARVMKMDKELGTIEPGKRADVILVAGDPLTDIHAIRNVVTVVARGRATTARSCGSSWGSRPDRRRRHNSATIPPSPFLADLPGPSHRRRTLPTPHQEIS